MNKKAKSILSAGILFLAALIFLFYFLPLVFGAVPDSAFRASLSTIPYSYIDRGANYNYTVTVDNNATAPGNITQVDIYLPTSFSFVIGTNGTSVPVAYYNFTNATMTNLSWYNKTYVGIINQSAKTQTFWFNATASASGTLNIAVNITTYNGSLYVLNTTNLAVTVVEPFLVTLNTESINRTISNEVNFSVTSGAAASNITLVNITLPQGVTFTAASNNTNVTLHTFSNTTSPGMNWIAWSITAGTGFPAATMRSFKFNATSTAAGQQTLTVVVARADSSSNTTQHTITTNFAFAGYVKNENGTFQNTTNVSIYQFVSSQTGPPTETLVGSVLTDANGYFNFTSINGSANNYKLKMIYYNGSAFGNYSVNSSAVATKVSSILPPFPAMLYYPMAFPPGAPEFMKPPTLNGTTFYLEPSATINITAYNQTIGAANVQKFGYEIMEQNTGFPVASNIMGNSNASVLAVVPLNRQYMIMALRDPSSFSFGACDGQFMNNTHCPTPPRSNSTINPTTAGQIINLPVNLSISRVYLSGCIAVTGNTTVVKNVTSIIQRLIPWTGFIPPVKDAGNNIDLWDTDTINYTDSNYTVVGARCNASGMIAFYNLSLMTSEYLIEIYGTNNSGASNGTNGEWLAALQNITMTANTNYNITLRALAGSYVGAANVDVNATKITINIQNSSGGAITSDTPHVEVFIKNTSSGMFGELHYIVETMTNGSFSIAIPRSSSARVRVFPNQAPPIEKTLNLNTVQNNITLISMTEGDGGFRQYNATSGKSDAVMNISSLAVRMDFLRYSSACNVIEPDMNSCNVTSMGATDFNPFTALVAGKINMRMKLTSSNVTMIFYNFDMFSAKQPPMNSIINDGASSGASTASQIWRFGSFVPPNVYDFVIIGIPYSDSVINDAEAIFTTVPYMFNETGGILWNRTAGDTTSNLTFDIDTYLDTQSTTNRSYNSSGYRTFLTSTGVQCAKENSSMIAGSNPIYCFANTTTNMIYMRLPHFSEVGPTVTATAPAAAAAAAGGGGGGGVSASIGELTAAGVTKSLYVGSVVPFKISNVSHTLTLLGLTANAVTVYLKSTTYTTTINKGDTKTFDLSGDGVAETSVFVENISVGTGNMWVAKITIKLISEAAPVVTPPANVTLCDNGVVDTGETCANCPADVKCAAGETCDNGVCKTIAVPIGTAIAWWIWLVIGLAVIIVVVIIILVSKKKKK